MDAWIFHELGVDGIERISHAFLTLHNISWLVGGLEHFICFHVFPYIGNSHPNWLIFFRGFEATSQLWWIYLEFLRFRTKRSICATFYDRSGDGFCYPWAHMNNWGRYILGFLFKQYTLSTTGMYQNSGHSSCQYILLHMSYRSLRFILDFLLHLP